MRGLIKSNFYLVVDSLRIGVICDFISLLIYIFYPNQVTLFIFIFVMIFILPCSSLNTEAIANSSKWIFYERSAPYSRTTIIFSRYLNYIIINFVCTLTIVVLGILIGQVSSTDFFNQILNMRGMRRFTVCEMFRTYFFQSHFINIVYYPVLYILNAEKVDAVIIIAIGISLVMVFITNSLSITALLILTFVSYIVSYVLSCSIVKRKKNN